MTDILLVTEEASASPGEAALAQRLTPQALARSRPLHANFTAVVGICELSIKAGAAT